MKEIQINEILPIREIENNRLLNSSLVESIAYKIEYPEVFLQDKSWFNSYQKSINTLFKLLPDYTILHTITFSDEENYQPKYEDCANLIQSYRQFNYAQRGVPNQEDYIILTFEKKEIEKSITNHILNTRKGLFSNFYKEAYERKDELDLEIESAKVSIQAQFIECKLTELSQIETTRLIYKYLAQEYDYKGDNFKLPNFNFKDYKIGDKFLGLISMYEGLKSESFKVPMIPKTKVVENNRTEFDNVGNINQSLMFPVTVGLPFPHIYSCIIQKLPVQKVVNSIDIELRSLNLPSIIGNVTAKNKKKHLNAYNDLITEHGYIPVNLAMTLIVTDDNKKNLQKKLILSKSTVENINDMKAVIENSEIPYLFFSNLPGNANQQYRKSYSTLSSAVAYLPKESHYKSDTKGFYFLDRFGKPFLLNILTHPAMTNKNGVVIGPSGRGKSYTLNYILSLLYSGSHLMIIDKGGSYKYLVELFRGKYFDSDKEEQFSFPIFECERSHDNKYQPDNLQYNFLQTLLLFIWKEDKKATPEEATILKELIKLYYEFVNDNKLRADLKGFEKFVTENWENFYTHFDKIKYQDYFDIGSFKLMMMPYVTGAEKTLFNGEKDIDLTYEKFVVFDLKSLEKSNPKRFDLLCIMITFLNIKKIQKLPRHIFKSFIIDEALSFLKGSMGEFIGNLFAEVRKENGQVLVVAQGIKFILEASSEVQEKIFNNRDFILMTNHSGYENSFKTYKELLGFNEKDVELLSSIKLRSEAFLKLGSKPYIVKIEASPEEDGIYTTSPEDMKTMKDLYKKYKSLPTAIQEYGKYKRNKQ